MMRSKRFIVAAEITRHLHFASPVNASEKESALAAFAARLNWNHERYEAHKGF
jgi:hypothetical protein